MAGNAIIDEKAAACSKSNRREVSFYFFMDQAHEFDSVTTSVKTTLSS
jgi:hypothetical protein